MTTPSNNPRHITPLEALQILDAATTPANIARLNRADFANIQAALEVLARALQPVDNSKAIGDEVVAAMNGKGPLTVPPRGGRNV